MDVVIGIQCVWPIGRLDPKAGFLTTPDEVARGLGEAGPKVAFGGFEIDHLRHQ